MLEVSFAKIPEFQLSL